MKYWQQWIASGSMLEISEADEEWEEEEDLGASGVLDDQRSGIFDEDSQPEEEEQEDSETTEDSGLDNFLRGLK